VAAAKRQAYAIASRQAKTAGHTPEDIRTIAMGAAVATEQALKRAAQSAASASAGSSSGLAPATKRRKAARRSGGDLNSQEQSAPRHASAMSGAASVGPGAKTSTPTIYLDVTSPEADNGDTPMAPSTRRSAPGFVIHAPLVPGYWLGPRVDASPLALGALSPASREAASMRSMHTGFMEPSLLVRAALSLGVL
jgi:hypothetical protein